FTPVTFTGDGRDLAGVDKYSGRFKVLWEPNEDFNALFQYEIIRDNSDSPVVVNEAEPISVFTSLGFAGVQAGDPLDFSNQSRRNDFFELESGHEIDIDGFYLNMEWNVGNYTIHSVTGYREEESRLPSTYMGELRASLFDATRDDNRDTFQQEIRIDSNYDGRFNFTVGAFYQESEVKFCVTQLLGLLDFFGPTFAPNTLLGGFTDGNGNPITLATNSHNDNASILCNRQDAEAIALFGDASFEFTDKLTIGFGVRQTYENKKWQGRSQTYFQLLDGTANGATEGLFATLGENLDAADFQRFPFNVATVEDSWTDPSFRVNFGYQWSDDIFVWSTVARSVKSGAFNDQTGTTTIGLPVPFTDPRTTAPIDPEFATSIEFGIKADLFDDRVRVNVVYFDVTYSDAQRQLNATTGNFQETRFFNAAELDAKGI
ncbi:MAG: TonB-dependent receptor, partial [Proteobacteria bacterium]|nr:TonB-dependent receptor [Pseudomonadota bacterium]